MNKEYTSEISCFIFIFEYIRFYLAEYGRKYETLLSCFRYVNIPQRLFMADSTHEVWNSRPSIRCRHIWIYREIFYLLECRKFNNNNLRLILSIMVTLSNTLLYSRGSSKDHIHSLIFFRYFILYTSHWLWVKILRMLRHKKREVSLPVKVSSVWKLTSSAPCWFLPRP